MGQTRESMKIRDAIYHLAVDAREDLALVRTLTARQFDGERRVDRMLSVAEKARERVDVMIRLLRRMNDLDIEEGTTVEGVLS